MRRIVSRSIVMLTAGIALWASVNCLTASDLLVPRIDEKSWRICETPDLGELNGPQLKKQQVVDHSFIRAANGAMALL